MTIHAELLSIVHESCDRAKAGLPVLALARKLGISDVDALLCGLIDTVFARYPVLSQEAPMTPYPQTLDVSGFLMDAMAFFRGQGDKAKVAHDAWEVAGYGLNKFLPDTAATMKATALPAFATLSNEEAADAIEKVMSQPRTVAAGSFDWHALLTLAIQAALKIIHDYFGV